MPSLCKPGISSYICGGTRRREERRSGFSLPNRRFGPAASPLPLNGKHDAEAEDDQAKDKHDTNNRSADLNPSACVRGHNCSTMYRVRTHGETQTQAHAVCGWCCIAMARAQVQSKGEGGLGEATIKDDKRKNRLLPFLTCKRRIKCANHLLSQDWQTQAEQGFQLATVTCTPQSSHRVLFLVITVHANWKKSMKLLLLCAGS